MKPYSNAVLTKDERYFNYRLSRGRMVVEGAYGQLKGRWSLLRKSGGNQYELKNVATLACMILHNNVCLERGHTIPAKLDLTIDAVTGERRDRAAIRDILLMKSSDKKVELSSARSEAIRKKIKGKLMKEFNTTTK